jgi:hypothetical protein
MRQIYADLIRDDPSYPRPSVFYSRFFPLNRKPDGIEIRSL